MVQSIIDIDDKKDRILNIIKAQNSFKNKSQAVEFVLQVYSDSFLEPELNPEYLKKLEKIDKEKGIEFRDIEELRKLIEE